METVVRAFTLKNRSLLLLNVVLLAVVLGLMWAPTAGAQNANQPNEGRNRGDYTMISGRTNSGGADAVYVMDASNQELIALRWDGGKQSLVGIGYRSLSADVRSVPGR